MRESKSGRFQSDANGGYPPPPPSDVVARRAHRRAVLIHPRGRMHHHASIPPTNDQHPNDHPALSNTSPRAVSFALRNPNQRTQNRRQRDARTPMSVLAAAQAQLPLVKGDDGEIMTQQFLSVCKLVFPVIGEVWRRRLDARGRARRLFFPSFGRVRRSTCPPLQTLPSQKQTSSARPLGSSRWTSEATST